MPVWPIMRPDLVSARTPRRGRRHSAGVVGVITSPGCLFVYALERGVNDAIRFYRIWTKRAGKSKSLSVVKGDGKGEQQ